MLIKLKTISEEKELNVNSNATLIDLKTIIEQTYGISLSEQIVIFESNTLNEDTQLLKDYMICEGSVINLTFRFSKFDVLVNLPNKDQFKIEMSPNDKISDMKVKIQSVSQISINEQVILYKGQAVDDHQSLEDCGINDASLINVIPKKRYNDKNIILRMGENDHCNINLAEDDDLPELKQKISDDLGIAKQDQKLLYKNKTVTDNDKFKDLGIEDAFTSLTIECKTIQLLVKAPDNRTISIGVTRNETIKSLQQKVQSKFGITSGEQVLTFHATVLEGDKRISDYPLGDKSAIDLFVRLRGGVELAKINVE